MENNSLCEQLYKLRDAIQANHLEYALMLSREVYEKLAYLTHHKKRKDCILECDITDKE